MTSGERAQNLAPKALKTNETESEIRSFGGRRDALCPVIASEAKRSDPTAPLAWPYPASNDHGAVGSPRCARDDSQPSF